MIALDIGSGCGGVVSSTNTTCSSCADTEYESRVVRNTMPMQNRKDFMILDQNSRYKIKKNGFDDSDDGWEDTDGPGRRQAEKLSVEFKMRTILSSHNQNSREK